MMSATAACNSWLARDSVFRSDRTKKSLTGSEQTANIVVMQSPSNRKQLTGPGNSVARKRFREGPLGASQARVCAPGVHKYRIAFGV